MHRLDMSVRITDSIAYNEAKTPKEYKQKFCLVMRRKFHFEKYQNTEEQIIQDPHLSKYLLVVQDTEGKTIPKFS